MKATRWQFSLRQLLLVMTVVAIVVMLVSHQWRFVVGFVTLVLAIIEGFYPLAEVLAGLLDPRNWRNVPERKPTQREIEKAAKEFAARYPKLPHATTNSGEQPDSK